MVSNVSTPIGRGFEAVDGSTKEASDSNWLVISKTAVTLEFNDEMVSKLPRL